MRIKSLVEEINSLRSALVEREESISKMRVDVNKYSSESHQLQGVRYSLYM